MNIRPSAAIRQNYNEIAELCRKTAEPVYLTKNGEGDLAVMDIESFNRQKKMLKLQEPDAMAKEQTYTAIVSDRTRRMLALHIRFLANMSKDS